MVERIAISVCIVLTFFFVFMFLAMSQDVTWEQVAAVSVGAGLLFFLITSLSPGRPKGRENQEGREHKR